MNDVGAVVRSPMRWLTPALKVSGIIGVPRGNGVWQLCAGLIAVSLGTVRLRLRP
ncbi:MAG: hypothetical protein ACRD2X_00350 [Vicinamibacteraceae bacterium]